MSNIYFKAHNTYFMQVGQGKDRENTQQSKEQGENHAENERRFEISEIYDGSRSYCKCGFCCELEILESIKFWIRVGKECWLKRLNDVYNAVRVIQDSQL